MAQAYTADDITGSVAVEYIKLGRTHAQERAAVRNTLWAATILLLFVESIIDQRDVASGTVMWMYGLERREYTRGSYHMMGRLVLCSVHVYHI